jgi:redox-sensitive bicupin YhaK (pirin superfamily)
MATAHAEAPTTVRKVERRTHGRSHGPITRLMSPSDFGELLKPFVFLDLFDTGGARSDGLALHPHSGIATLTFLMEGSVTYEDTNGATGMLRRGEVEWMKAGGGVWHGGGFGDEGGAKGFQLWIALPPEAELGASESIYLSPAAIPADGPVRVLLGRYGDLASPLTPPSAMTYLAVTLKAGERWRFVPPSGQDVGWLALAYGRIEVPAEIDAGELVAFERSTAPIEIRALEDSEFVVGSAERHPHDLVLGYYSVHTSPAALDAGEARIAEIHQQLIHEGRLAAPN